MHILARLEFYEFTLQSEIQQLMNNYKYQVALSFASEQRDYVADVANHLKDFGIVFFYDRFEVVEGWGKNLAEHLGSIFAQQSKYVVMFISKEYVDKAWPSHERQHALCRMIDARREYILPVRFDDTIVPGLAEDVWYLSANDYSPATLAEAIAKKLEIQPTIDKTSDVPETDSAKSVDVINYSDGEIKTCPYCGRYGTFAEYDTEGYGPAWECEACGYDIGESELEYGKACPKCGKYTYAGFPMGRSGKDTLHYYCRACHHIKTPPPPGPGLRYIDYRIPPY